MKMITLLCAICAIMLASPKEEGHTTNLSTYGKVQNTENAALQGIAIVTEIEGVSLTDTVYTNENGEFFSRVRSIPYPIPAVTVKAIDLQGVYQTQSINTEYMYECGTDFVPENNYAFPSDEIVFTLSKKSGRWCLPSYRTDTEPWIEVSGTFQMAGYPCDPDLDEACADCMTIVLKTDDGIYYLVSDNGQVIEQLDNVTIGLSATVAGIPFTRGIHKYIQVSKIDTESLRLPSLCDEWNMLVEPFSCDGPYWYLHTTIFRLTTDTIIEANRYVKLGTQTTYSGALREGSNHDIYYIPAGSTHEYLLYAFNAQVGDRLTNLWIGGVANECPNGYSGTVQSISDGTPRIFTLDIDPVEDGIIPLQSKWIEGVGFTDNPTGPQFYLHSAVDYGVETILCAYKEGEQVYASGLSKRYGCQFDGVPSAKPFYLCDEWNILEVSDVTSGSETYSTHKHRLTQDTLIADQSYYPFIRYVRLEEDGQYSGAIREGGNQEIYYIPAGSTHEYLLYAFNAHEGDQLRNLWIGGNASDYPNGWTMTVVDIQETIPRTFVLSTGYTHTEDGIENDPLYTTWIEGVGLLEGPVGAKRCVGCVDSRAHGVLCAYKNGEQVYVSEWGAEYGCVYNDEEQSGDTIPIYSYTGDDPGSSTVDPVDPNQVVVTLKGDELTIKESSGDEINFKLTNTSVASSAAKAPKSDDEQSFRNEVSVQLTEDGNYQLILTNPNWDYKIYGTFRYAHQGLGRVNDESSATKILRDGQVLIERNGRVYSVTGMEIK